MTRVGELVAYPVKSLDGVAVEQAELGTHGALRGDRSYAFVEAGVDPDEASVGGGGGYVNGKTEPAIHGLRASYELARSTDATPTVVTLRRPARDGIDAAERTFALPDDRAALEAWVGEYLGYPVDLVRDPSGGFPDDREASGPTVVSEATLSAFASWFDAVADATEARRRLRPNVVLADCPAFWEDRLFADRDARVRFSIGGADLFGVNPCQRCVVPSRDPDTGEEHPAFRETFVRERRAAMPAWSGGDWFDHDFRLMVNTVVPDRSWGRVVAVDDPVRIGETVSVDDVMPTDDAHDGTRSTDGAEVN
ncbi:MOSC domain-containing protein [Halorubrum sp. DTA98]|uniref:MOSC domain-containing protein n=1 Tax=Halorubrum sp. DTA98 TaxID=3402163 RepID=UPI003AABD106